MKNSILQFFEIIFLKNNANYLFLIKYFVNLILIYYFLIFIIYYLLIFIIYYLFNTLKY